MNDFVSTLLLTVKLAFFTTLILFIISVPLAYFLAYSKFRLRIIIEALISLPLVLPPTVIGYYLLVAFSPTSFSGALLDKYFNVNLAFSFGGILLGSIIYSLPFMVHPMESGFSNIPQSMREAAKSLGKSSWITLIKVLLPNIKPSILTALVLTFAHTVGEFGIVLMIGGSIPNKTKVVSIAIFNEVEALNYGIADKYALILFGFSFIILILFYFKIAKPIPNQYD